MTSNESEKVEIAATNNGTHLPVVGKDLDSIPSDLHGRFGSHVESIDFSFNNIKKIEHLQKFTKLKTLVLDNNELEDIEGLPSLQKLETLWLNKNNIKDIDHVIDTVLKQCPNLTYLSLLNNPACPNEFTGADNDDYQRHRFYVLYRLKNLKFLDSKKVSDVERKEAEKRGAFCQVKKPEYDKIQASNDNGNDLMDNQNTLETHKKEGSQSYFGYTRQVYTGKHSEGNRFIRNNDL